MWKLAGQAQLGKNLLEGFEQEFAEGRSKGLNIEQMTSKYLNEPTWVILWKDLGFEPEWLIEMAKGAK